MRTTRASPFEPQPAGRVNPRIAPDFLGRREESGCLRCVALLLLRYGGAALRAAQTCRPTRWSAGPRGFVVCQAVRSALMRAEGGSGAGPGCALRFGEPGFRRCKKPVRSYSLGMKAISSFHPTILALVGAAVSLAATASS